MSVFSNDLRFVVLPVWHPKFGGSEEEYVSFRVLGIHDNKKK